MKKLTRKSVKLSLLTLVLTAFAFSASGADKHMQTSFTGVVAGRAIDGRTILVKQAETSKPYRVGLAAKIRLLDGSKGTFDDLLGGDTVDIKLDSNTGDIRDITVIAQY